MPLAEDPDTLDGYYASVYLPTVVSRSDSWKKQIGWAMDQHIRPELGHLPLRDIDRTTLQNLFNRMTSISPSARGKVKIVLSGVLNLAVRDGIIQSNPAQHVRLPRQPKKPVPVMDWPELWTGLQKVPAEFRPIAILMGCCGLRVSEACAVTWADIENGVLTVSRQTTTKGIADILKTDSSYRRIPIPAGMLEALACGRRGVFLATNEVGRHYLRSNVGRAFERAKVPNPHAWRHTYASLMENDLEAPRRIVDALMGHAGKGGVSDRYSHTFQRQLAKWQEAFWERLVSESEGQQLRVRERR